MNMEAIAPQNIEAEECVLASIILDDSSFPEARSLLRSGSFFQPDYEIIWGSMCALADSGKPPGDPMLLRDHLISRGVYKDIGGDPTLARLARDTHFTGTFVGHYASIVAEKSKLRNLIQLCGQIVAQCNAPTNAIDPSDKIANRLETEAARIRDTGFLETIRPIEDIIHEIIEAKQEKKTERFLTGLAEIDDLTGGIPVAGMTLIAGKAGMGKSQTAKQFIRNIAAGGIPCGIVTVEETGPKIAENYLAGASGVPNNRIVHNTMCEEEFVQVVGAVPQVANLPIFIDDAQHSLSGIQKTIRRMVRKYKCRAIMVDHLHLIDGEYDGSREQEISRISGGLKHVFKELGVAGIVVAQLNRGSGVERESPPELDNLRGSGSLEQDGDLILMLHRADYYNWKKFGSNFTPDHRLRIFCNKNKSGNVGYRDCRFNGDSQTVTDWTGPAADGSGPEPTVGMRESDAKKLAARICNLWPGRLNLGHKAECVRAFKECRKADVERAIGEHYQSKQCFDLQQLLAACRPLESQIA